MSPRRKDRSARLSPEMSQGSPGSYEEQPAQHLGSGDRRARDPTFRGCRKYEDGGKEPQVEGGKDCAPRIAVL